MYKNKLDVFGILTFFDRVVETQFKESDETAILNTLLLGSFGLYAESV